MNGESVTEHLDIRQVVEAATGRWSKRKIVASMVQHWSKSMSVTKRRVVQVIAVRRSRTLQSNEANIPTKFSILPSVSETRIISLL